VRPPAPRLIFIPDPAFHPGGEVGEMARAGVAGGADAIQMRAKGRSDAALLELGSRLAALCRARGARFFVNDRADIARSCGADGVHLGPEDDAPEAARRLLGPRALIGVSVYTEEDLRRAEAVGAAYAAVGAVFPTRTKEIAVVGPEGVRAWRARTDLPLVAIGGIAAANAAAAVEAGADGVAVVSALSAAPDIEAAARELRRAVDAALARRDASPAGERSRGRERGTARRGSPRPRGGTGPGQGARR